MKVISLTLLSLLGFLLVGCGKNESAGSVTAAPANGPKTFALTASDTMKYNLTHLEAKPGEEVKLTLTNIGMTPKAAMAHNWVLLKKGTDLTAFDTAAISHQADGYFPTQLDNEVLAHTKLLGPKESDTITFKAPTEPGNYDYLCTFPGHFQAGMHGTLVVQ